MVASISSATAASMPAKAAICASCHGAEGNSTISEYPSLAGQRALYLKRQLQAFRAAATNDHQTGRQNPVMSAMAATLSDAEINELSEYYARQEPSAASAVNKVNREGKKLFLGGDLSRDIAACAACHGADGKGMAAAGFPAIAGQHQDYLSAQLQAFRSGKRKDDYQGMMQDTCSKLTDDDIQALAQYMAQLPH